MTGVEKVAGPKCSLLQNSFAASCLKESLMRYAELGNSAAAAPAHLALSNSNSPDPKLLNSCSYTVENHCQFRSG